MKEAPAVIRGNRVAAVVVACAAVLGFGALTATAGTAEAAPVHVHGISGSGQNATPGGIQGSGARPGGINGGGQNAITDGIQGTGHP
jgi:hypothetical protein